MWTKMNGGRRWGQLSTYRFAAVKLNAGVRSTSSSTFVDVDVERHGNGHERAACDESSDVAVHLYRTGGSVSRRWWLLNGSSTVNSVNLSGCDSTVISPPWASTRPLAMNNPRPAESGSAEVWGLAGWGWSE